MRLLVTRPEPDAQRTAATLRARGHGVIVSPLMHVEATASDFGAGPWAAVLMTSANAARMMARHPRGDQLKILPLFAVGNRSAQAAREAGFAGVISADGDMHDLARLVAAKCAGASGRLLYLAGEERSGDLGGALASHGLAVETVAVYRTVAATEFTTEAQAAIGQEQLGGVLHFSERSAANYVACAVAAGLSGRALVPAQYCLSRQVAGPLLAAGAGTVTIARRPDEAGLIDMIAAD